MLTSRHNGHVAGWCSIALGAASALRFASSHRFIEAVAAAVTFGVGGVYLLTKLYLDDPEARRDYRRDILSTPFSVCCGRYNIDDMLRLFEAREIAARFGDEFGVMPHSDCGATFSRASRVLQPTTVWELADREIIAPREWRQRFLNDVATCESKKSFTTLWLLIGPNLPEFTRRGLCDVEPSRRLLLAEFDWADPVTGRPQASRGGLPTADQTAPGAPMGVLRAVDAFGPFAVDALGCTPLFWRTILSTSTYGETADFRALFDDGLLTAHRRGFVDVAWARKKFRAAYVEGSVASQRSLTNGPQNQTRACLWDVDDAFNVRTLLQTGLLEVADVEPLFYAALLPLADRGGFAPWQVGASCERSTNVIAFCEYWEDLLRPHPSLVAAPHRERLRAWYHFFLKQRAAATRNHEQERHQLQRRINEMEQRRSKAKIDAIGAKHGAGSAAYVEQETERLILDARRHIVAQDAALAARIVALKRECHDGFTRGGVPSGASLSIAWNGDATCSQQ